MSKTLKRLLSLLLAAVMTFTLIPYIETDVHAANVIVRTVELESAISGPSIGAPIYYPTVKSVNGDESLASCIAVYSLNAWCYNEI